VIEGDKLTLPAARDKFCKGLEEWAASFSVATEKHRAEELAKITEKYTKHGITGDRLKLLVDNDNTYFHGKGCNGGITDIKELKKAKLLFYWTEASSYGPWTVYRYEFKGDKLKKLTSREFTNLDSAYKWCK
jgi:hypothetical protein